MLESTVFHQVGEKIAWTIFVVQIEHIGRYAVESVLRVPADETEPLVQPLAVAESYPVVMIPVCIAHVLVDEHVVDEIVHIDKHFGFAFVTDRKLPDEHLVVFHVRGSFGETHHLVPSIQRAFSGFKIILSLDDIIVDFLVTEVKLAIIVINVKI